MSQYRIIISFLIFACPYQNIHAKSSPLSDSAVITVLTCEPGEELYSVFGHTAVRVYDPVKGLDMVYNYGLFDFETPHFYWKFSRGRLKYMLGKSNFQNFMYEYLVENRSVYEQILNLSKDEIQQLYEFLEWNYKPENRYYLYDFFYNNCSTKIIDILINYFGLEYFNEEFFTQSANISFRDAISPHLVNKKWEKLGIDLALGLPADKIMTRKESTFLPLILMEQLSKTSLRPVAKEPKTIFQSMPEAVDEGFYFTPLTVAWVLFFIFLILSVWQYITGKGLGIADKILYSVIGVVGGLVFFLWFFTNHQAMHVNFNLWWAFPLHLPAIYIRYSQNSGWIRKYFSVTVIALLILVLAWRFIPQNLNEAVFPMVLILLLRSFMLAHPGFRKKNL